MPIITLEMGPLSTEQKEKLIVAFTRDVCEVTGMPSGCPNTCIDLYKSLNK